MIDMDGSSAISAEEFFAVMRGEDEDEEMTYAGLSAPARRAGAAPAFPAVNPLPRGAKMCAAAAARVPMEAGT
jgi:hypothetical protein